MQEQLRGCNNIPFFLQLTALIACSFCEGRTQCFLSRFWVSKWHPKILEWHPKFWKPRYGFVLYWSKTNWGKHIFLHVAIATDGCNVIDPHNFLAQKLEAKIVSLVSVHRHAHRFTSASITMLPQICTVWCTKLRKYFNAIMEVLSCFTVAISLPADASDYNEDKRSAVAARMQNKMVVEWGNSES